VAGSSWMVVRDLWVVVGGERLGGWLLVGGYVEGN